MKKLLSALILLGISSALCAQQQCPLCFAAASGDLTQIELLLEQGANVNDISADGTPPLLYAVDGKHSDAALLLLQHHADPNSNGIGNTSAYRTRGITPLILAAGGSVDIPLTLALIQAGAKVDTQDKDGCTALIYAARHAGEDSRQMIRILLDAHANPNLQANNHDTALSEAVVMAHILPDAFYMQSVQDLLAAGADTNLGNPDKGLPLVLAVEPPLSGQLDAKPDGRDIDKHLLALLLANGANPNLHDPLLLDKIHARRDLAELLVNSGLEVDLQNSDAATALDLAVDRDDLPQATLLLSLGANPQARYQSAFPLAIAARKNDVEMVRQLLDYGATPQPFAGHAQSTLSETDFPNPVIRKLLQDRLAPELQAVDILKRYPDGETAMKKLIQDHALSVADAQHMTGFLSATPTDPGLLVLAILFNVGSGKNQPIPAEALQHEQAGNAAYAAAKSRTQFLSAGNEFVQAARLAPWMPAYPRNACLLLMMAGAYSQAEPLCYAYKLVVPADTAFDQLLLPYTQNQARLAAHQ